jgi:hypothetical protein
VAVPGFGALTSDATGPGDAAPVAPAEAAWRRNPLSFIRTGVIGAILALRDRRSKGVR